MRHQELAEAVLLTPALKRLDAIFRQDRLPIMPAQTVAQREGVGHAIRRHGRLIDHLRFHLTVLVGAKQRVIDQIAVVTRDVCGGPERVEDLQIGLGDEAERLELLLGADRGRTQRRSRGNRCHASDDLSTTNPVHTCVPLPRQEPIDFLNRFSP